MLVIPTLTTFLVVASLSLHSLAFLLYLHDRHSPELRFSAMVTFSVGAVSLAFASLVWMESNLAAKTARTVPVPMYAKSTAGDSGERQ